MKPKSTLGAVEAGTATIPARKTRATLRVFGVGEPLSGRCTAVGVGRAVMAVSSFGTSGFLHPGWR